MVFGVHVVANVGALHPENYIFRDIGGVVGYALEVAGHEQRVEGLAYHLGTLVHGLHQLDEGIVAHAVDHVVHLEHGLGEFDLAFDKRLQSAAHHGTDGRSHAGDVDGQFDRRQIHHVHHPLGDVDGLVADALEVRIDLGDGEDEAQIHG